MYYFVHEHCLYHEMYAQDWGKALCLNMLKVVVLFLKDCCWVVVPGSCGNISDGSSRSSSYGTDDRTPPTLSRPDFPQGTAVTHACLNLNLKPNGQLESSSSEDLPAGSSHSTPSPTLYAKPTNRNEARPPPPPYRHSRLTPSVVSSSSVVSQSQQHPQQHGKTGNQNSSSPAGTLMPTSPEWQDWQRDRWHIWQLLSSDNADTLPETLVWCQAERFSVLYRSHCLMRVMYRLFWGLSPIIIFYRQKGGAELHCGNQNQCECSSSWGRFQAANHSSVTDHAFGVELKN